MKEPSGFKAILGSITHKALEGLARKKLAMQNNEPTFADEETGTVFDTNLFEEEQAIKFAFDYYVKRETHHTFTGKDFRLTRKWMIDCMEMQSGRWNPLNRDVIAPEQYFDFEIKQDWARYSYPMPDGTRLEGYLALKGTVDLITKIDNDTLEYADWKTGKRKDWATGLPKDWKKLRDDPQLRMYHYALTRLYPQYKHIIMTIVFIQDGGPFSLDFGPDDLPKTEQMLKERFDLIRNCERPPRIIHDRTHRWKCSKLCHFGKTKWEGTNKTICDYMHKELITLGMDKVTAKYADMATIGNYGAGGGSSNREKLDQKDL